MPMLRLLITEDEYKKIETVANSLYFKTPEEFIGFVIVKLSNIIDTALQKQLNPIDVLEELFADCLQKVFQK